MIRSKISKIAKKTNCRYRVAKKRVENLAPVMEGVNRFQKINAACDKVLENIATQDAVFVNVNFMNLYRDIL